MARSHKYISRSRKRELGIPTNVWDAARSLNERRVAAGEESIPLRSILKEEEFRRNWAIYNATRRVKISSLETRREKRNTFMARVEAASYWGWWTEQDDGKWRYVE